MKRLPMLGSSLFVLASACTSAKAQYPRELADRFMRVDELRGLRITYGAWLYPEAYGEPHTLEVECIRLERSGPG